MSLIDALEEQGFTVDYDSVDFDLMNEAAEKNDVENYIKLRQLHLLKEIRDGISELTEAIYGIN